MRDEIGKLREQAKLSERAKELSQQKCASLAKQIKDFEMIINRYAIDREKNPGIYIPPTKINPPFMYGSKHLNLLRLTNCLFSFKVCASSGKASY